ncbi:MAG: CrcB family protein, partial [Pseudomonadota bacterium]|nr:CrcB family protein [Pseudomonadota bacterium]
LNLTLRDTVRLVRPKPLISAQLGPHALVCERNDWRGFIAVGFLGALTTFSSFALDAGQLAARQGIAMTALYVGLSVCLSLAAFFASQAIAAHLVARMSG